jgi:hypothetical protein
MGAEEPHRTLQVHTELASPLPFQLLLTPAAERSGGPLIRRRLSNEPGADVLAALHVQEGTIRGREKAEAGV